MEEIIQILQEILSSTEEDTTQYQVMRVMKKLKGIKEGELTLYRGLEIYQIFEKKKEDIKRWLNLNDELLEEKMRERRFSETEIRFCILSLLNKYGK